MGDLDINEKRKKKCVSLFILKLMRKEKKKCVSLFIHKHDSQLFPALKFTSWGISLSCWELPVSPVLLCYHLPTQTVILPSLLLMLVPPPRKRFYPTQILLPSLGHELLFSSRVCSNVFTKSSMSSGIVGFISSLSEDVCLIDLSHCWKLPALSSLPSPESGT